jgi:hypothetical protein
VTIKRWLYRGGRPNGIAKILNAGWAMIHSTGIAPNYLVTLDVVGRKSGKTINFPLVMTIIDGKRYLVSMLGENANWVGNVRAAGGKATLRHGHSGQSKGADTEGVFATRTGCAATYGDRQGCTDRGV